MKTRMGWRNTSLIIVFALSAAALLVGRPAAATENWFERGLVNLKEGQYQQAVEAFSIAIESVPHDFEALNNRGFARIYTGDYDGAIADCSRAIEFNPGSAKAYNNRGFAYIFKESYAVAIADFDRAIAINPRYVDAYSNRCLAWIRQARYPQAIADCSQALAINPRSAKSLYNRGFARDRQGDPAGALGDYIQTLTVNREYIEVFNNIAWILATSPDDRLRDGQRAVALAEKAAAHAPDLNFMDTLAAAYAEAGRFDEAVAMENRVISMIAARGTGGELGLHVERLSLYEEGRPYRDRVQVHSVSAVTDLNRKFETLDRLMQPQEIHAADYQPMERDAAPAAALQTIAADDPPAPAVQIAQAPSPPGTTEIQVKDQTVFTPAGEPVEITLGAESGDRQPVTFDIETVPLKGALRGTLPNLIYTPRAEFSGTDRFTFRAGSATGQSRLATVIINVGQPPDATAVKSDGPVPPDPAPLVVQEAAPAAVESSPMTEAADDSMPTPAVSLPAELMPGTPAVKPAGGPATAADAPAAAAAPAPEPSTRLPAGLAPDSVYSIQVRSVQDPAKAEEEVAKLRRQEYAAFSHPIDIPGKGLWHRIFVGGYATKAAARQALAELDAIRFKGAYVRRIPDALRRSVAPAPLPDPPAAVEPDPVPPPEFPAAEAEIQTTYPYSFQIKSYRKKNDAFQLGVELTSLGRKTLIGVSRLGTTGDWYRVYVGCFNTPEEGEKMRDDLAAEGFEDAFLTIIPYTIAIRPPEHDPRGETLENQLLAKGYLPYRLPESGNDRHDLVLLGGFQSQAEAQSTLEALKTIGYDAQIVLR
jgi:tetratricopeptide (TPR) repeat protein/cell division protein FtsN